MALKNLRKRPRPAPQLPAKILDLSQVDETWEEFEGKHAYMPTLDWDQGGTLHGATVKQWHEGTHADRLATCSDWVSAFRSWDQQFTASGDIWESFIEPRDPEGWIQIRYAMYLRDVLTEGTKDNVDAVGHLNVSDIAMFAAHKLGWLKIKEVEL
jgi:hypothetical protein